MLDDEQHLVVPRRRAAGSRQRLLRRQQLVEPQVAGVGQAVGEIGDDAGFEVARGHGHAPHGVHGRNGQYNDAGGDECALC